MYFFSDDGRYFSMNAGESLLTPTGFNDTLAVIKIQRWWRNISWKRYINDSCVNVYENGELEGTGQGANGYESDDESVGVGFPYRHNHFVYQSDESDGESDDESDDERSESDDERSESDDERSYESDDGESYNNYGGNIKKMYNIISSNYFKIVLVVFSLYTYNALK